MSVQVNRIHEGAWTQHQHKSVFKSKNFFLLMQEHGSQKVAM